MLTARDFWGDEYWKEMKRDYDELMAYRKTIKGKPNVYQRLILDMNQSFIDYYNTALFHHTGSSCDCRDCANTKKYAADERKRVAEDKKIAVTKSIKHSKLLLQFGYWKNLWV